MPDGPRDAISRQSRRDERLGEMLGGLGLTIVNDRRRREFVSALGEDPAQAIPWLIELYVTQHARRTAVRRGRRSCRRPSITASPRVARRRGRSSSRPRRKSARRRRARRRRSSRRYGQPSRSSRPMRRTRRGGQEITAERRQSQPTRLRFSNARSRAALVRGTDGRRTGKSTGTSGDGAGGVTSVGPRWYNGIPLDRFRRKFARS